MSYPKAILIIDDEAGLRLTLSLILQGAGYQVETADGAKQALDHLKNRKFDLAFLDLNLPEMDGFELLRMIHQQVDDLPVLIITAHATLETAIRAVRLGARDYLIKPVEPPLILARVKEVFAEIEQPKRRLEIVSQMQSLLTELRQIDGANATPTSVLASVPPVELNRFLEKGPFNLDLHTRHATLNGQYLPVTGINFDYLTTLLRHAPTPVSNINLVKESQGFEATTMEARDLARWRIHELRKIIETDASQPQHLLTVRGEGYRIVL
ncbi:MAG: response regulator transcription factor [Anaerolineales bacterium]|nr:response regulator transcription factor [Anaerolineales bacterium]